ncbi:hypothetical protein YC2023_115783 [Brassica napus]
MPSFSPSFSPSRSLVLESVIAYASATPRCSEGRVVSCRSLASASSIFSSSSPANPFEAVPEEFPSKVRVFEP